RKVIIQPGDANYPSDCRQGPAFLVYTLHFDDATSSWVDDARTDDNPTVICHGKDGAPGQNGRDGAPGQNGAQGAHGDRGDRGQDGPSFRKVIIPPGAPNYPADCQQGSAFIVYTLHFDDATSSWADDALTTDNPTVICHG